MKKRCPICDGPMEEGLCLSCGYDVSLDGDLSIVPDNKKKKKSDSLLDILLGEDNNSDWPL